MRYLCLFLLAVISSFLLSCQGEAPLPNTPETVSRQWQEHLNNNQFAEAKKLSTPNAQEWLNWIEKMLLAESPEEELSPPVFLEMSCSELKDQATCVYLQEDDGEQFRDSFLLLKLNGQWLIDIPQEDLEMDDGLENLLNEMENILNEETE